MKKTNEEWLRQHEEAVALATEMFGGIWEDALMWMQIPTKTTFGMSPADAIFSGNGEEVISWLKSRTKA